MSDQATDKHDETTEVAAEPGEGGQHQALNTPEPSLEEQLEAARKKSEENWDLLLRSKAELENLRKRAQRDVENAHKYGLERMAGELLAVRDSMELGLSAAQDSNDLASLKEGVLLTLKLLIQLMEKFGIAEINPENQKFNPELHQAIATQESDKLEPNTVISVMQKGYLLKDRLLRPALVTVAKAINGSQKSS
jgi:molecular chaperone GrpE